LAALLAGEGLGRAFGFITTIYLARTLGVSQFGLVETAFAVLVYLQIVVDGGLDLVATRSVARAPHTRVVFAENVLALRLILAGTAFLGVVAFNAVTFRPAVLEDMLFRMSFTMLPLAWSVAWAFQSSQRMRAVAAAQVITYVAFLSFVVLLVRDRTDALRVPLAYAAAAACGAAAMFAWYVRRYGWTRLRVDVAFWRHVLPQAIPVAGGRMLRAVSFNFDVLLLGYFYSEFLVGLYAAAYRLISVPLVLYVHAFTAMFPSLVDLPPARRTRTFASIVAAAAASGIVIALVLSLAAEPALRLLMGEAFTGGAPALRVLAWSIPLTAIGGVLRQALLTADRQRADLIVVAIAAVTNASLNVVLIPRAGLVGAATATIIGESVVILAGFVAVARTHALRLPMIHAGQTPEDAEP
jgi:PST family polysaccharide transporter